MGKYDRELNKYKVKPLELYLIKTDTGPIYVDKQGIWWFGGSSQIGLAVFQTKKEADLFRRKIKRERPSAIRWTSIERVFLVKKKERQTKAVEERQ